MMRLLAGALGIDTFAAGIPFGHFFTADVGASSIRLGIQLAPGGVSVSFGNNDFQAIGFASLDWPDDPTGILVGATLADTNVATLTEADFTVGNHQLGIFIGNTTWANNSFAEIGLITAHAVTGLPAPMSLALFAIGLGGLGTAMRRPAAATADGSAPP